MFTSQISPALNFIRRTHIQINTLRINHNWIAGAGWPHCSDLQPRSDLHAISSRRWTKSQTIVIMSIPDSSVENGLTEALIPSSSADFVVNIDTGESGPVVRSNPPDQDGSDLNPYEFMGAKGFTLPPPCPIDPFRNRTESITGVYEWIKIIVCLPLALLRLALFGVAIVVGFLATKLALQGWKDKNNPIPRWRSRIMWITRICARCILFSFGYAIIWFWFSIVQFFLLWIFCLK